MKRHNGKYPAPLIPIRGWMSGPELEWLYLRAMEHRVIVEVGSAFGRSSHALLSGNWEAFGNFGRVYCVDVWPGHIKETKEEFNYDVKDLERRWEFSRNTFSFPNLSVLEIPSIWASNLIKLHDINPDMVFLDGGTKQMRIDILHWRSSSPFMLFCGHDYSEEYPSAMVAIDELVPERKLVEGTSLWYVDRVISKEAM